MRRLAALFLLACIPTAEAAAPLAAHHAVYKLVLQSARGDIIAATGTMTYDITDACTGWTSAQRLQMTVTNRDGQDVRMLSDYATWEAKDGTKLDFHMRQTTDQAVTDQIDGEATLDHSGGSGAVRYTSPQAKMMALPDGTLLPMAHTAALIAAAEAGKRFLALPLFDGTGTDGAQDTFITIANWGGPQPVAWPGLSKLPSGRVHIAFFTRAKSAQTPDYEIGMRYWENGVADDLSMNFGDFTMQGRLSEFHLAAPPHC
ncbi:MAG TPA: DUF1849 family protein [Acetobacteraceae bacterium]|nr:DUF1849 family protein [Acetobacteraceae bacterium]